MKRYDAKAPATKDDLRILEKRMASKEDLHSLEKKLRLASKEDFSAFEEKVDTKIERAKDEIIRHLNLVAENMRHDWLGATQDQFESLKGRVSRLERHTGLAQAAA